MSPIFPVNNAIAYALDAHESFLLYVVSTISPVIAVRMNSYANILVVE